MYNITQILTSGQLVQHLKYNQQWTHSTICAYKI